jgi:aubergine-like protein
MPKEAIAELTYEQCFNYPNWTGAVRVPGVLQSANKISTLFSEHMHDTLVSIKDKNL